MGYYYYGFDPTVIYILPAILLALYAQIRVKSTYAKYEKVGNHRGLTGERAARMILDRNGLKNVKIGHVAGKLTDHYDPRTNIVNLSDGVYDNASIAAVGIAAHEVGHAIQHNLGYFPIKARNTILPVVQVSSQLALPLIILGFIFSAFSFLIEVGIILYAAVVAFQIITLPVELNASKRALRSVYELGCLDEEETRSAKRVLSAAALTYVAAAATAILQLLRLITIAGGGRRRD